MAADHVEGLDDRPVGAAANAADLRRALGGPLPDGPSRPRRGRRSRSPPAGRRRAGRLGRAALLRVRGRRRPARRPGRRLAGRDLGPERRPVRARPGRGHGRGGRRRLAHRPARAAGDRQHRFVTGGQMASFTGLAAARHHVLAAAGWDVESDGLSGAPPVEVVVGAERHVTIDAALRFLGLGSRPRRSFPPTARAAWTRPPCPRCWPPARGRRSCAPRPATSTPAPSTRCRDLRRRPRPRRLGARGRGVRALGGGQPGPAPPGRRGRAGRLGGHRRPQVAQRPLRQRARVRGPPRGPPGRLLHRGRLPERPGGWRARPRRLHPRVLAARQGVPGLGGAALPRPLRRRRHGGARLRPGLPLRHALGAADGVEVLNEVVLNQVLVRFPDPGGDHDGRTREVVRRGPGRWHPGWAAPPGTAWRPCASRCRTGRPPTPTSTARRGGHPGRGRPARPAPRPAGCLPGPPAGPPRRAHRHQPLASGPAATVARWPSDWL